MFRKAEKREKTSSKTLFSTSEIFHEVEFFWVRFAAKEALFGKVVIPTLQCRNESDLFYREKNSPKMNFRTFRVFSSNYAF